MPSIRVLSVNARATTGGRAALVELIAAQQADLVCVHAAPSLIRWRQAIGAIARRAGLVVVGGGGWQAGSVLLLSSLGVDVGATRDVRFTGSGGLHPPGGSIAGVRWRGKDLLFAGVTLVGSSAVRLAQIGELHAAMTDLVPGDRPAIISAEGTDRPGTAAWQALGENRAAVASRVFVDRRIGVGEPQAPNGHPFSVPVVVDLTVD